MKTASYVIIEKVSKTALFETFSSVVANAINTDKYRAVPILEYLQSISKGN